MGAGFVDKQGKTRLIRHKRGACGTKIYFCGLKWRIPTYSFSVVEYLGVQASRSTLFRGHLLGFLRHHIFVIPLQAVIENAV